MTDARTDERTYEQTLDELVSAAVRLGKTPADLERELLGTQTPEALPEPESEER